MRRKGGRVSRRRWISRASAKQRGGRAGRVGPGVLFRFYPEKFFSERFKEYDDPEMMSASLDNVVLSCVGGGVV